MKRKSVRSLTSHFLVDESSAKSIKGENLMKKVLCSFGVMIITSMCNDIGHAADVRPYLDAHVGAVVTVDSNLGNSKVSSDPGFVAGGAIGLDFELLRIEANIDYRRTNISKFASNNVNSDLQLLSYMVNGHLVAPLPLPVKPYLLGGVGFATAFISDFAGSPQGSKVNRDSLTN